MTIVMIRANGTARLGSRASPAGTGTTSYPPNAKIRSSPVAESCASDGESAIRLSLDGLAPNSRGDAYEAWLMDGPERLVSLGSFRVGPSGSATVTLPVPAAPGRYRFVDVSRERLDGDPGHSGTSVLRGPTRA